MTYWIKQPDLTVERIRKWAEGCVAALNHALRNIPPEKVRHHTCYGINMGPRVHDLELKHIIDVILKIRAGAYSFEAANPRHEHEWKVWETVKLPPGTSLIPGVISHSTVLVEHPELVAQRIERYAQVVGPRERHRGRRLRLCDLRELEGGAPEHRMGQVPVAGRGCADRQPASCGASERLAEYAQRVSSATSNDGSGARGKSPLR